MTSTDRTFVHVELGIGENLRNVARTYNDRVGAVSAFSYHPTVSNRIVDNALVLRLLLGSCQQDGPQPSKHLPPAGLYQSCGTRHFGNG